MRICTTTVCCKRPSLPSTVCNQVSCSSAACQNQGRRIRICVCISTSVCISSDSQPVYARCRLSKICNLLLLVCRVCDTQLQIYNYSYRTSGITKTPLDSFMGLDPPQKRSLPLITWDRHRPLDACAPSRVIQPPRCGKSACALRYRYTNLPQFILRYTTVLCCTSTHRDTSALNMQFNDVPNIQFKVISLVVHFL